MGFRVLHNFVVKICYVTLLNSVPRSSVSLPVLSLKIAADVPK